MSVEPYNNFFLLVRIVLASNNSEQRKDISTFHHLSILLRKPVKNNKSNFLGIRALLQELLICFNLGPQLWHLHYESALLSLICIIAISKSQ